MDWKARRARAYTALQAAHAGSLLVTAPADVRWLTGFTGSSAALALLPGARAGSGQAVLFTDARYTAQAAAEAEGVPVRIVKGAPATKAAAWLATKLGAPASKAIGCGFDGGVTTVAALAAMVKALPESWSRRERNGFFGELDGVIGKLRAVKDAEEQDRMRHASELGCALFGHMLENLQPGMTEVEVAAQLEFAARNAGADAMSFETIVAGGSRGAMPHARATSAPLPQRGFVVIDFGVVLDGYCSDMTRTVHMGKANRRARDVYDAVLAAERAGIDAVRAGVPAKAVDAAARGVLKRAGLAKWFTHSTGHGVGLEIHEAPRVAAKVEEPLAAGMAITIEPGVYIAGEFGVRIEDLVLVTDEGCEVLSAGADRELIEL